MSNIPVFSRKVNGKRATNGRPSFYLAAAAAVVVVAATAATVVSSHITAVVATAAEQDQQDDDPAPVTTETTVIAHKEYLQIFVAVFAAHSKIFHDGKLVHWVEATW